MYCTSNYSHNHMHIYFRIKVILFYLLHMVDKHDYSDRKPKGKSL